MKSLFEQWRADARSLVDAPIGRRTVLLTLGATVISCVAIRLWMIGSPSLDRTSWKEIDFISISRNYWQNGNAFIDPEIWWPAEPPRITAMEFPLVPYLASKGYSFLGFDEFSVRLPTLVAFSLLPLYVFLLCRREVGTLVGLLAGTASAIMPLYHPFGRILYSEPLMILASVAALYHAARWVDGQRRMDWLLATVSFSLAIALKIEPLYLLLPLGWTFFRRHRWKLQPYRGFVVAGASTATSPVAGSAEAPTRQDCRASGMRVCVSPGA